MFKIYNGYKEVTKEALEAIMEQVYKSMEQTKLSRGDILVCKACTQLGIIVEWMVCQEKELIPFFVAPDYAIEHSDFMKYTDAEYCLELDGKENIQLLQLKKGTGSHLEIAPGAVIHMTSATSGKPKFIVRTKEQLELEVKRYCETLQLTEKDTILSIAPFYHAYAFLCPMLGSIYAGAALVQPDILLPRNVIELCKKMKVNCLFGIPYFFDKMTETDEQYMLYEHMRYVVSSGEKLIEETAKRFHNRFGISLNQQYGSTETGTITFSQGDDPFECQGKPIEGVEFKIVQEDGKNYVTVNTHGTMGSYIREKVTPIAEDFYKTSDLGYFDKEGRLFIEGRGDDIIIRAGEKINIREIARIIEKFPGIEGAQIKVGEDTLKELTCYYNAPKEIAAAELISFCRKYLSEFQIPKHYIKKNDQVGEAQNWKHKKQ